MRHVFKDTLCQPFREADLNLAAERSVSNSGRPFRMLEARTADMARIAGDPGRASLI
jgi:hypothetical protein